MSVLDKDLQVKIQVFGPTTIDYADWKYRYGDEPPKDLYSDSKARPELIEEFSKALGEILMDNPYDAHWTLRLYQNFISRIASLWECSMDEIMVTQQQRFYRPTRCGTGMFPQLTRIEATRSKYNKMILINLEPKYEVIRDWSYGITKSKG